MFRAKKLWLYIQTVRHLTVRQLFFQVVRRLGRPVRSWASPVACQFIKPEIRIRPFPRWNADVEVEMFSHHYRFLNRTARIQNESGCKVDWEFAAEGGLWLDHLHYMRYWDGLAARLTAEEEARLLHWLEKWSTHLKATAHSKALNPPYNASERAFSIGRFLLTHEELSNPELVKLIQLTIARDLNYVASKLEYHLGGNHLLKNLMALAWGVCLFEGEDARKWQAILNKVLASELRHQILADGFHYERSPMYHNIALLDLLDVINIARDGPLRDHFLTLSGRMIAATKLVTHPDGEISFFNDCALDLCPRSIDIIKYGESIYGSVEKPKFLPHAGLYSLEAGNEVYVIAKYGALGAEEQMGHVHSDLFSFEMSANGQRVFINSGTSTYYDQPFRDHERSGHAHNTAVVHGNPQCQHWSSFRVASRARPGDVRFQLLPQGGATLSGDLRLIGKRPRPRLARKIQSYGIGSLVITDTVSEARSFASSSFHLDPVVSILAVDESIRRVSLKIPSGQKVFFHYSGGRLAIEDCLVSRQFNLRMPSKKLVIRQWNEPNEFSSLVVNIGLDLEESQIFDVT